MDRISSDPTLKGEVRSLKKVQLINRHVFAEFLGKVLHCKHGYSIIRFYQDLLLFPHKSQQTSNIESSCARLMTFMVMFIQWKWTNPFIVHRYGLSKCI